MLTIFSQHIYTKEVVAKSNTTYKYSNTQIDLPPSLVSQILKWGKDNIPDEDISEEEEGTGREDEIHVTCAYGLHEILPDKLSKCINNFGNISVELGEITRFTTNDKHDVIKIEVIGDRLRELRKLILDNFPCENKYPDYRPHVTIAYIKKGRCRDLSGCEKFVGINFSVNEIVFSSKNGKKYTIPLKVGRE